MENQELTFGEKLVGKSFNPSQDPRVDRAKEICAELADMVSEGISFESLPSLNRELYRHTIGQILNAQMNVVKLLTLKV